MRMSQPNCSESGDFSYICLNFLVLMVQVRQNSERMCLLLWCLFFDPQLPTFHSNIGVWFRKATNSHLYIFCAFKNNMKHKCWSVFLLLQFTLCNFWSLRNWIVVRKLQSLPRKKIVLASAFCGSLLPYLQSQYIPCELICCVLMCIHGACLSCCCLRRLVDSMDSSAVWKKKISGPYCNIENNLWVIKEVMGTLWTMRPRMLRSVCVCVFTPWWLPQPWAPKLLSQNHHHDFECTSYHVFGAIFLATPSSQQNSWNSWKLSRLLMSKCWVVWR